ncbi:MAG TPA: hypothetical protein VLN56_06790 [Gammaproteobacteria bacterium]|nr:hypothetical protein [Gammaproteobacteria bacterium]
MKIINALLVLIVLIVGIAGIAYLMKTGIVEELVTENTANGDDDDGTPEEDRIHIIGGYKAIELDEEQLETVGLSTARLTGMNFRPEFSAYARVVDIAPLVSLRTEYKNLRAEKKIVENALQSLRANLRRARALHEARSLSTRELERVRAEVDQKIVELNAMNTRIESLVYKIHSEWGEVIGDIALNPEKQAAFDRLAMHRDALVMLSLPKDKTLTNTGQGVFISHTSHREDAIPSTYIDQAKKAGNPLYGESYFYLLESGKIRPEMRLFAWIEESDETMTGLFVPEEAVVWYANKPWVYIQHEDNLFIRKPLSNAVKIEKGWFLSDGIGADDQVVVSGGQTLLSEEFKWAIPDEDAD